MPEMQCTAQLILASTSAIRRQMCQNIGLPVQCVSPNLDEEILKSSLSHYSPSKLAQSLAEAKALSVSAQYPDAYVIAADQVCALGDRIFDKSGTLEVALEHLLALQGQTHVQHSGYAIAHGSRIVLSGVEIARLKMHAWSEKELLKYIAQEKPFGSAGSYKFESIGRLLFAEVLGTTDTILGLALTPILNYLRGKTVIAF